MKNSFDKLLADVKHLFATFEETHKQEPTKVWIPVARQNDLLSARADVVGDDIASKLTVDGPKAFRTLGKLEIVWEGTVLAVGIDDETRVTLD